jgi:S1-C subfamily serine protease
MSIEKGVVQVFSDKTIVDYSHPWAFSHKERSTGSGFIIELHDFLKPTKYILTNAHCVNDSSYTTIKKQGISQAFKATIEAIGYEVDLAILSVDNEDFWKDTTALTIGTMPHKLANVHVYGFPLGGNNISITQGVVNRIRVIPYFNATKNITIQIDAPINFGNSGGPALDDTGKVVGVAFAGEDDMRTQNMGYLIPGLIVEFFFRMIQKYKKFPGLCYMGLSYQKIQNSMVREYHNLPPNHTGVLVTNIQVTSTIYDLLNPGDIIMRLDGINIDTDGQVAVKDVLTYKNKGTLMPLVSDERVSFLNLVSLHLPGEYIEMEIWRKGKVKNVKFKTRLRNFLVPILPYQAVPSYFILGGLVFVPLTFMMVERLLDIDQDEVSHLLMYSDEEKEFPDQQKLVLTEILLSEMTEGYHNKMDVLESINGVEIKNLEHMFRVVNEQTKTRKHILLAFENTPNILILKSTDVRKYSRSIAVDQIGVTDIYYNDTSVINGSKVVRAARFRATEIAKMSNKKY